MSETSLDLLTTFFFPPHLQRTGIGLWITLSVLSMAVILWFSSNKSQREANQPNPIESAETPSGLGVCPTLPLDATDFDELCLRVESQQAEWLRAVELCKQANQKFQQYRQQINQLKETTLKHEQEISVLLQSVQDSERQRSSLINELRATLCKPDQNRQTLLNIVSKWENMTVELATVQAQLKLNARIVAKANATADSQALLPRQPFVVVLIDGDGYRFATWQAGPRQGTENAQRLHLQISRYILDHPQIPAHSKIVVRIFSNCRDALARPVTQASIQFSPLAEQMVRFSETQPLFDWMDCGRGKERADEKLRENFRLYLSQVDCHLTFLAVCNDNGYARMLEPYQCNPVAQSKIVLIETGQVVAEIEKLPFARVHLKDVFHPHIWKKPGGKAINSQMAPSVDQLRHLVTQVGTATEEEANWGKKKSKKAKRSRMGQNADQNDQKRAKPKQVGRKRKAAAMSKHGGSTRQLPQKGPMATTFVGLGNIVQLTGDAFRLLTLNHAVDPRVCKIDVPPARCDGGDGNIIRLDVD